MHPNPAFRNTPEWRTNYVLRHRGFATLCVNGDGALLLSHIPYMMTPNGEAARFHLVRSNPIARLPDGPAVLAVMGPDGYVSPDYYGLDDQVPTWNYVAVHARGHLERRPDDELRELLEAQSAFFEEQLEGKRPWTMDKMTPEVAERMMRQIVPYTLHVEDVQSTWKLNQNKPDSARLAAADAVEEETIGFESDALAEMMRRVPLTED